MPPTKSIPIWRMPVMWLALLAMWLLLTRSLALGDVLLGVLVAAAAMRAFARMHPGIDAPRTGRLATPWRFLALTVVVFIDVVKSNIAVARIVLTPHRGRAAGFVDIPLDTRHPGALAGLACIITATPGTTWATYDSSTNVITIHVLDLADRDHLVNAIRYRYQPRLREIFE